MLSIHTYSQSTLVLLEGQVKSYPLSVQQTCSRTLAHATSWEVDRAHWVAAAMTLFWRTVSSATWATFLAFSTNMAAALATALARFIRISCTTGGKAGKTNTSHFYATLINRLALYYCTGIWLVQRKGQMIYATGLYLQLNILFELRNLNNKKLNIRVVTPYSHGYNEFLISWAAVTGYRAFLSILRWEQWLWYMDERSVTWNLSSVSLSPIWRRRSPLAWPMLPAAVSTVCLGCKHTHRGYETAFRHLVWNSIILHLEMLLLRKTCPVFLMCCMLHQCWSDS